MTPQEVIWFINHKYKERAYLVENEAELRIFTKESVWRIFKSDWQCYGGYYLYHSNKIYGSGYHRQGGLAKNLARIVWYAALHDSLDLTFPRDYNHWADFNKSFELYSYGQHLWESCCRFAFLAGEENFLFPFCLG